MRYVKRHFRLVLLMLLVIVASIAPAGAQKHDKSQDEALTLYHNGIAAQTIGARERYLEEALELYLARLNSMKERGAVNGLLCYNIGNCYFNLGQNEEAIFYYQLAKKILPTNDVVDANLSVALEKRTNAVDIDSGGLLENLLFFHYKWGPAQQVKTLAGVAIVVAVSLVWLLLIPSIVARYLSLISGFVAILLFLSVAVGYYMPTHMGILMKSSDIRRGAGTGFAPITTSPLGGGSSIEVLSLVDGWYSVKLNDGRQGYIQQQHLKVVTI